MDIISLFLAHLLVSVLHCLSVSRSLCLSVSLSFLMGFKQHSEFRVFGVCGPGRVSVFGACLGRQFKQP